MARIGWVLLAILAASYVSDAYKILVVFPLPGKSHSILGDGIVRHLLNAGHEVTFITSVPKKNNVDKNLTQVDVSSNFDLIPADMMNIKTIIDGTSKMEETIMLFIMNHIASETLTHKNVLKLLEDKTQYFDLVIAEWMFNELYSGLATIYQVPLIWFTSLEPVSLFTSLIEENLNPAYVGWSVQELPPFTFMQRLQELLFTIKMSVVRETVAAFVQYRSYNNIIVPHLEKRGIAPPSFSEVKYNASLALANSHVSMGLPVTVPQMFKPIGGFHIEDETKPLPQDLQKLLDEAKDGVIYFSMGSNLKSKDFPQQIKTDLLKMFGTLKQTVLWKFEEEMSDLPKNVHILKWAPQVAILSHPNCRLFITHGGLLSTTESIHTGTPIIGIPVFGDQFANVKRAESRGFAKAVSLSYTMSGNLKEAILDMLSNPKYSKKVKELSYIYHDRPVKPGVEIVHWAEHVVVTQGAPHLRSIALHVPWYQKVFLDVAIVFGIILYLLVKFFKIVKSLLFKKKVNDDKKKK